ncbi:MAG: hypothetical protein VKK97_10950 [Synechococcaceae cyanobacterium]|nr:hypothetical protein [Synechococcaceae cyanobacterium]
MTFTIPVWVLQVAGGLAVLVVLLFAALGIAVFIALAGAKWY